MLLVELSERVAPLLFVSQSYLPRRVSGRVRRAQRRGQPNYVEQAQESFARPEPAQLFRLPEDSLVLIRERPMEPRVGTSHT